MADETKTLDLDELFGDARPVKVKWGGKEYELLRLEAFSPREINAFQKMQIDAQNLQQQPTLQQKIDGYDPDAEIVTLFDKMLIQLCPSLPLDSIPFLAKSRIITFYIEETAGKKALEVALSQMTGVTPSAG